MNTFELLCIVLTIFGGFWMLCQKLTKIEVAITKKVGYGECMERQASCPCHKKIEEIKTEIDKKHPRR